MYSDSPKKIFLGNMDLDYKTNINFLPRPFFIDLQAEKPG
jgi:hypothetical protein